MAQTSNAFGYFDHEDWINSQSFHDVPTSAMSAEKHTRDQIDKWCRRHDRAMHKFAKVSDKATRELHDRIDKLKTQVKKLTAAMEKGR